jgi:hypothetical protein
VDIFGLQGWLPYPGTGLAPQTNTPAPAEENGELYSKSECKKRVKEQNRKIASLIVSGPTELDCGDDYGKCTKISIVITIPHPCQKLTGIVHKDAGNYGHMGLGVGDDFYDFGPHGYTNTGGPHWMRENPTITSVSDYIKTNYNKKNNTIIYEFCGCKKTSEYARSKMYDYSGYPYNAKHPYGTCVGAVTCSLGHAMPYESVSSVADSFLDERSELHRINECGPSKGNTGIVRWISALSEE